MKTRDVLPGVLTRVHMVRCGQAVGRAMCHAREAFMIEEKRKGNADWAHRAKLLQSSSRHTRAKQQDGNSPEFVDQGALA